MSGALQPVARRRTLRSQKREWKVIVDPSETQTFLGRLFRRTDLKSGGGFQQGTVFEHTVTGERMQSQMNGTRTVKASDE